MKDYFGYSGKKCVVTGAASGMGKATAEMLVAVGAEVYGLDWNPVEIPGMKKFIQVDLSKKESIDKAFEELPKHFECYFGVAGISGLNHTAQLAMIINFAANKYITENYLMDRIKENGAVAYVSSVGGSKWFKFENEYKDIVEAKTWDEMVAAIESKGAMMGPQGYVISKRAMTYYTKWIVPEFAKKAVRVNAIAPGLTVSGLQVDFQTMSGGKKQAGDKMYGIYDRSASSEEMAHALVFLCSDMATYINGVELFVDAGREALVQVHGALDNNGAPMLAR